MTRDLRGERGLWPRRILIAPQGYKGSLDASGVATAMAQGVRSVAPEAEITQLPVADGGEGTISALLSVIGGERRSAEVRDPLGNPASAEWAMLHTGLAAIEMAAASGLSLVPRDRRNPGITSTYGTGQLIAAALDAGAPEILVGIGGSATNDGGSGALQALGARLLNASGHELSPGGLALLHLHRIDASHLDPRVRLARLRVLCDVTNPLCGPRGSSAVFGPQKGATPEMIEQLDLALRRWADVIARDFGELVCDAPGAGAAGGLGAGLLALGGTLEAGADVILDFVNFEKRLDGVDLVITGEGLLDGQSTFGKTTIAVARRSRDAGIPVLAVVGGLAPDYAACYGEGVGGVMPIIPRPMSLLEAQANAAELIADATARAIRLIRI